MQTTLAISRSAPAHGRPRASPDSSPLPAPGMIVVALILILAGSCTGAAVLWVQGASFWGIALGYVGGGWAGLAMGLPLALLLRRSGGNRTPRPARHSPARRRA